MLSYSKKVGRGVLMTCEPGLMSMVSTVQVDATEPAGSCLDIPNMFTCNTVKWS